MDSCEQEVKSPYIPFEILLQIFILLPFESVLSCKLVSKQWKNLINDPKFYKSYHNKSVALQFGRDGLLCLLTKHGINTTNDQLPPYTVHHLPIKIKRDNGLLDFELLSGSSNTIACVKTPEDEYCFHNLFTGASYSVKRQPKKEKYHLFRVWICFGFGYDRHSDDYKILEVYTYNCGFYAKNIEKDFNMNGYLFRVYSFKNRCWKSLHGYPYDLYQPPMSKGACSFNSVLHWVVSNALAKRVVLTYDLHTCKFGEIALPDAGSEIGWEDTCRTIKLSELDGRLCYVYQTNTNLCVWVMQEYDVEESWTKLLALDATIMTGEIGSKFLQAMPAILYERGDGGKVVLFTRCVGAPRMFWYDIDKKEIIEV